VGQFVVENSNDLGIEIYSGSLISNFKILGKFLNSKPHFFTHGKVSVSLPWEDFCKDFKEDNVTDLS
jgi:hypothetical protein